MPTTADFEEKIPDGWPPREEIEMMDQDDEPQPAKKNCRIPIGTFEVHAREDLAKMLIRWHDVQAVLACPNPKDGTKIMVRGIGFFVADEPYMAVLAMMNECYEAMEKTDRGY